LLGYEFKKKYVPSKKPVKENLHYKDIGEYLFKDKFGELSEEVDLTKANQIYNEYVNVMVQIHKRLNSHYKRTVNECLNDDQKGTLGEKIETDPLIHPGDDSEEGRIYYNI
jgi:hypothetical protein